MTELVRYTDGVPIAVLSPLTGEVVTLAGSSDARLADVLAATNTARDQLADVDRAVKDELLRRMDASASWTMRVDDERGQGWKLSAPSPAAGGTYYDADTLHRELVALADEGVLAMSAVEAAVRRPFPKPPPLKVYDAGVKALAKLGRADVDAAILAARRETPAPARTVTVKPA